jgi:uracil phosphoribosyltransferase
MTLYPQHPLLHSWINRLRDSSLDPYRFRHGIREVTRLLAYEGLRDAPMESRSVPTWNGERQYDFLAEEEIVVVSVLRAALPMHEAVLEEITGAVSGFLGMKRDEDTHKSILYYDRVGDCRGKTVIIVDPMVATGGSLCDAIDVVKIKGADRIVSLNVIASPEGVAAVEAKHPDIILVIGQLDEGLSDEKFILPGLGDAGDRAFNT